MPARPGANRPIKGRGALSRTRGRFDSRSIDPEWDDQLDDPRDDQLQRNPDTTLTAMPARRIVSHNQSPDIPFDRSINPYQGCEHGCVYCYARPSHSYLDLSPGLDFETRIFFKPNAAERLFAEWNKPGYVVKPITIGANTDPYQPAEKAQQITRSLLQVFHACRHPVSIITKGTLIRRDLDLLADLAQENLASVAVSIPTANAALKRCLEPRVPSAEARFRVLEALNRAAVPTTLMIAPVIPALNDQEIESLLARAEAAGTGRAGWILLRLPHEVKAIFKEWLTQHFPDRASHVMSLLRQASGGKDYDNRFGHRQRGSGAYAGLLAKRFELACKQLGMHPREDGQALDCSRFLRPGGEQIGLPF